MNGLGKIVISFWAFIIGGLVVGKLTGLLTTTQDILIFFAVLVLVFLGYNITKAKSPVARRRAQEAEERKAAAQKSRNRSGGKKKKR